MEFLQALKKNLLPNSSVFDISSRASRSEYWWTYLGIILLNFVVGIAALVLLFLGIMSTISPTGAGLMFLLFLAVFGFYSIFVTISSFTVLVRRLHDTDRSGWNILWIFLPIAGPLYMLYMLVSPGTQGANRFGANPLEKIEV